MLSLGALAFNNVVPAFFGVALAFRCFFKRDQPQSKLTSAVVFLAFALSAVALVLWVFHFLLLTGAVATPRF